MKDKSGWPVIWLLCLLLTTLIFFFSYRLAEIYLFANLGNLVAVGTILPTAFTFLFSGTTALCAGLFVFQLIRNHFYKKIIRFYYIIYLIILICSLLFKSPGISGYNFDLFDIVTQFYTQPEFLLVNQLIFIPLGVFVAIKELRLKRNILISFIFSLVIETIQFIFKLGLFDIIDIFANTTGSLIGFLLAQEALCHVSLIHSDTYISINKIPAVSDEHKFARLVRRIVLIVWLIQACILIFLSFKMPSYEKESTFIPTGSLQGLDRLSKTDSKLKKDFDNDILVLKGNIVKFEGFCELGDFWEDADASTHWGISITIIDKQSQNKAYIVPAVLSSNNKVSQSPGAKELIASPQAQKATITAHIEDGWFEITNIQLDKSLSTDSDDKQLLQEVFPWQYYGKIEASLKQQTTPAKKIGYISSLTQIEEKTFISVCTYDYLCNVPIIRLQNITVKNDWTPEGKDLGSPEHPVFFDKEFKNNLS